MPTPRCAGVCMREQRRSTRRISSSRCRSSADGGSEQPRRLDELGDVGTLALVLTRRQAGTLTSVGVRILIVSAVLSMAGCASYAQRYAQANEEGLKAAGFEKRLADTPEKLAYVQRLTQRRILVYKWQGRLYYAWPDARFCQCIYVGKEATGWAPIFSQSGSQPGLCWR